MRAATLRAMLSQAISTAHAERWGHMHEAPFSGEAPTVEGVITRQSPFAMAETIERLRAALIRYGMTIFAEIDHADAAQRAGLAMQPAHVLMFGSPRAGTPLMIASPLLALDLPLRLLVWQGAGSRVWVSSTSAAYLQQRYAIAQGLVGRIAGADAVIAQALGAG